MASTDGRWSSRTISVFADPEHAEARQLEADALEQLGYQSESAIWRNYLLTGALELRDGVQERREVIAAGRDIARNLPVDMVFDAMGARLHGPKAAGKRLVVNWDFTDIGEHWVMTVENAALSTVRGRLDDRADVTISLTRDALDALILGGPGAAAKKYLTRQIELSGRRRKLGELLSLFEEPDQAFNVVTP